MLIPSIDLMEGKIVQLIQGEEKALEFDDFSPWIERFSRFPLVQVIDLDAALGRGNNRLLVEGLSRRLACQVGGGIRNKKDAIELLDAGARRVIIGSSLFTEGKIQTSFAEQLATATGSERLVFAVDSRHGTIVTRGWRTATGVTAVDAIGILQPWCEAFLYTNVDTEGLLQGFPLGIARELRQVTGRQLIVAGGIASEEEVSELDRLGVDAVVGMAIYSGKFLITQD